MGHLVRVHNQQVQIKGVLAQLAPQDVLVLMDYKMKFEPLYYREQLETAVSVDLLEAPAEAAYNGDIDDTYEVWDKENEDE